MSAQVRFDDTINTESTIVLHKRLLEASPAAARIILIWDDAR